MADLTFAYSLVGAVILLAFVYVVYRTVLRRRALLLREGIQAPTEDRAFNQIRIARAGAQHLAAQGRDVRSVTLRLDEAENRHRRGDASGALELAERARLDLRNLQRGEPTFGGGGSTGPALSDADSAAALEDSPPTAEALPGADDRERESPRPPRPPAGMIQARFTLSLLDQELAKAKAERASSPEVADAIRLRETAQTEFNEEQYGAAWQSALRARRRLGSPIEGVALGASAVSSEPSPNPAPGGATTCSTCGHPLRSGDRFCRGCGKSVGASKCPRCGTTVDSGDGFCAACGAPIST